MIYFGKKASCSILREISFKENGLCSNEGIFRFIKTMGEGQTYLEMNTFNPILGIKKQVEDKEHSTCFRSKTKMTRTGFEPVTSCLSSKRSPTELTSHNHNIFILLPFGKYIYNYTYLYKNVKFFICNSMY